MTINSSRAISSIGIVGAGNMGASIAVAVSQLGLPIKLIDNYPNALESGMKRIDKMFSSLERKLTKTNTSDKDQNKHSTKVLDIQIRKKLIEPITKYEDLHDVDLVIEAVNEDIEIKKSLLQILDKICKPKTIFASNTSSFSITQLASFTNRSKQVIGLHFFNPAHIMSLVEVIPGLNTASDVMDTAIDFVKLLDKLPVKVEECASFLVNRLLSRYLNEAIWILQNGLANIKTIDEAACQRLMPIGPLQLRDMNGLDIGLSVAHFNYNEYGERFQPPTLLEKMVEKNILGKKTLAGFYLYKEDERKPIAINPELESLIHIIRGEQSCFINELLQSDNKQLPPFEAMQLFLPMINETFLLMQEKIVAPVDIDPALKAGLGMRQGPLEFAFQYGLENCLKKIEILFKAYGERYRPAPLLKRYVWAGKNSL